MKALIQNENGLLINGDSYTTPDTIRIDNTAYSFVVSANEDIIIGDTNSGYMTALNEDGDSDQSVDLPIIDDPVNSYATYYDVDTKAFKTIGEEEFMVNGDFSTGDFTGWSNTDLLTIDANRAYLAPPGVLSNLLLQTPTLVVGRTYKYTFTQELIAGSGQLGLILGTTEIASNLKDPYNEVTFVAVNTNDTIKLRVGTDIETYFDNFTLKEVLPVGTTYNMTDSFSSYFTTDVPVTDGDRAKLNANPNLIYDLWFGSTITGLSFTKANVINFIPATEGIDGGDTVTDISDATGYVIQNYTANCRTFYVDEVYGFQNVLADQDGSGRITGIADLTTVDMIEPLRVRSPDGTVWIITVDDLGVVSAVEEV